jgi:hypothetical protein
MVNCERLVAVPAARSRMESEQVLLPTKLTKPCYESSLGYFSNHSPIIETSVPESST